MTTTSDDDDLLDTIDELNERLRWSLAIAALIAAYEDTDQIIRDGADSIERHLRAARRLLGSLKVP
jgi:hypothetical protein